MSLRTIMIFPEFDNMEIINEIREKYDPLANLVKPHITIVFPFESTMTRKELADILDDRLKNVNSFTLTLNGVNKAEDSFGNFLFLEVTDGREEMINMHDSLYQNEFSKWDLGLPYKPHMTIGNLPDAVSLQDAYDEIKLCKTTFTTIVKKVSVEMIGEQEESIIIMEKSII